MGGYNGHMNSTGQDRKGGDGMDVAIWALILLMAFTGFFMVIGGFAALLYIIWQRGKDDKGRESTAGETN